jgi:uncharacterized protein YbjT (DUF2867 family)
MRVLIVGASGLIGSAIAGRLAGRGDAVVAVTRRHGGAGASLSGMAEVTMDVAQATDPADWLAYLGGVDAVVNCAGVLQDSPRDSTGGVQAGVTALFRACEQAGVHRVVHVSALGVERHSSTAFARSKLATDEALMACELDWVILRLSVVIGRPAYGGSALIRGLAAMPILPRVPDTGEMAIVHLDDLVESVLFFLEPHAPVRRVLEIVGPRRWSFEAVIRVFRQWLRLAPARHFPLPRWASLALFRLGDALSLLGWRPPVRTTARLEIEQGSVGDPSEWTRLTGIKPRDLATALIAEPASVQERWFARLYFLKPVVLATLSLFWILTGLIALAGGYQSGKALMQEAGLGELAGPLFIAGAILDIAIGAAIAVRALAGAALYAALGVSVCYALAATILLPRLWADPLGPTVKIIPILVLNLVALAILDDR